VTTTVRESLLGACQAFMRPIARFLLRNGIGYREFSEVAKTAFVKVATDDYGVRGRPTNISRTAVMTGLTRKEVKRIREKLDNEQDGSQPRLGRPARLLELWHHEDDFVGEDGLPRTLEMDGPMGFRALVRRCGGDVPPGAILTELKNAGAVEELPGGKYRCIKRYFNPAGIDPYMANRYGEVMRDLAATLFFNSTHPEEHGRRFEYRVWNDEVDTRHVAKFQTLVREHGTNFLEFLDDWLVAHQATDSGGGNKSVRCGLGIYYFSDETPKARKTTRKGRETDQR